MSESLIVCHRGYHDNLQVIYLSRYDGYLSRDEGVPYLLWQDSKTGGWNEHAPLTSETFSTLALAQGNLDNLQLVGLRKTDQLPFLIWQSSQDGKWNSYGLLPCNNVPFVDLVMARGDHDSLQVILIGKNDSLPYLIWQNSADGSWNWYGKLPCQVQLESVKVCRGNNNALQVIGIGKLDHLPYLIWQDAGNGSWHWYGKLPGDIPFESIIAARGSSDNLQVIGIGRNDHFLYLIWQASGNGSWNWSGRLPGNIPLEAVAAARGNNQNLQVVGVGKMDHHPYLLWQDNTNHSWNWYGELPHNGDPLLSYLAAAQGNNNNLQVVCLEQNDIGPHLFWQSSYNGAWYPMDLSKMMNIKLRRLLQYYFSPCDIDNDGVREIESMSPFDFESEFEMIDFDRKLVIIAVESRLFDDIPGITYPQTGSELVQRLRTYKSDLQSEGFQSRFLKAKLYSGTVKQDGKILVALREFFKLVRHTYRNFEGAVLVGSFPDGRITHLWPEYKERNLLRGFVRKFYGEGGFLFESPRFDIVLADVEGHWRELYHDQITLDRHAYEITDHTVVVDQPDKVILTNPEIVLNDPQEPTPGPRDLKDTFFIKDAGQKETTLPGGTIQVDFPLLDTNPEACDSDKKLPNPIATPKISISRINARSIAVNPPRNTDALDGNGKPQEAVRNFSQEDWCRDPALERRLLIDYFDRNHAFRSGAYAGLGFNISILESADYGSGLAFDEVDHLKPRGPIQETHNATLLDMIRWLKTPFAFRAISTHANSRSTQLKPMTDIDVLNAEKEAGGNPWRWIAEGGKIRPSFKGYQNADLSLFRTLWENKVLAGICPSLMLHVGCNANVPDHSDRPYNDPLYGTFQNAESLLFYGNQLAILCHVAEWNRNPSGFGEKFGSSPTATFGDGWKGFSEKWSQDGSLLQVQVDRKRNYEWSIVGDWTLRKFYESSLPQPKIRVTPNSINFGQSPSGVPVNRRITIYNDGKQALQCQSSISPLGTFALAPGSCRSTAPQINPGSSCSLQVTFIPPGQSSYQGQLTITSNDPNNPNIVVKLQGKGQKGIPP